MSTFQEIRLGLIQRSQGAGSAFARMPPGRQQALAALTFLLLANSFAVFAFACLRFAWLDSSDKKIIAAAWLLLNALAYGLIGRAVRALMLKISVGRADSSALGALRRFMDSSAEAVYGVDTEGVCNFCNRACLRLLGYEEASQLLGSDMHGLVFDRMGEKAEACPIVAAMHAGKNLHIAERLARRSDGARITVECRSSLVHEGTRVLGAAVTLNDISAAKAARNALKRDREALEMQLHDLSRHTREVALFGELAEMIQAGSGTVEICKIVSAFAQELFPSSAGTLYLLDPSSESLQPRVSWGVADAAPTEAFALDDCWALRRGKPHYRENHREDLYCAHVSSPMPAFTLCLPLSGQGSTLGMLHLRAGALETVMTASRQQTAVALAYQVALGLSNMRLKEILRDEAIRDPVTGLFNRRFMQESLEHEIQRAQRGGACVGVLALDLDHFKEANDTLGHAAGDALLMGLAGLLKSSFRAEDICCRQGGDEFLVILPDISEGDALVRAEALRLALDHLTRVQFPALGGNVTLSAGLAMYPADASSPEGLQKAADLALYRAKSLGRNRVCSASQLQALR